MCTYCEASSLNIDKKKSFLGISVVLQRTVLSLLDCMIDSHTPSAECTVHYNILEADENGHPPDHPCYDKSDTSCLHIIALTGNKVCGFRKKKESISYE